MFRLAAPGALAELLETAGLDDVDVQTVPLERSFADMDAFLAETRDLSSIFRESIDGLPASRCVDVRDRIAELAEPYTQTDGSLRFPGSALVASGGLNRSLQGESHVAGVFLPASWGHNAPP